MKRITVGLVAALAATAISAWAQQDPAKKAYMVAQIEVSNPQHYAEYMKVSPAIIDKFGGRFIARGGRAETLEGPAARGRIVIIEFPSFERAQQFYNSPEYGAAKKLRAGAAAFQSVLVESF